MDSKEPKKHDVPPLTAKERKEAAEKVTSVRIGGAPVDVTGPVTGAALYRAARSSTGDQMVTLVGPTGATVPDDENVIDPIVAYTVMSHSFPVQTMAVPGGDTHPIGYRFTDKDGVVWEKKTRFTPATGNEHYYQRV
jgi:hypothetical protein